MEDPIPIISGIKGLLAFFFFFFLKSHLPAYAIRHGRAPPTGRHLRTMRSRRRRSIGPTHAQGKRQRKERQKP